MMTLQLLVWVYNTVHAHTVPGRCSDAYCCNQLESTAASQCDVTRDDDNCQRTSTAPGRCSAL